MYKITIVKIEESEGFESSYERISDTGGQDGKTLYGYVKKPVIVVRETTILSQTTEEIDLKAVIKAVNNIE